jgi:hypothetical protein
VGQGPGGAGQDALEPIAGEVAGLGAGLDVGHAHPDTVQEVCEFDGLHRADLDALTALDAGRQELLFVLQVLEGPRWAQPGVGGADQGQQTGQGDTDHANPEP